MADIFDTAESLRAGLAGLGDMLQVQVAGSIRRGKRDPKDIEIVALVRAEQDMFGFCGEPSGAGTQYVLERASSVAKKGQRYVQCVIDGHKVDYFQTWDADAFGLLLVIRTGPWEHSSRVLAQWKHVSHGGCSTFCRLRLPDDTPVATPTERSVYDLLGWDYIAPEDRR